MYTRQDVRTELLVWEKNGGRTLFFKKFTFKLGSGGASL